MALTHRKRPVEGRPAVLSVAEECRLARKWRTSGDRRALDRLVEANLGLVTHIAGEYLRGAPNEDLIQEGRLGLVIAARRFDPDRGVRLATYGAFWIRACMLNLILRTHGPVDVGRGRRNRRIFFGLARARQRIERGGAPAELDELAQALGVRLEEVEMMMPRLQGRDPSLDEPRSSEDQRALGAGMAHDGPTPEELVSGRDEEQHRQRRFKEALKTLDPRELEILRARHLTEEPATLAVLSEKLGVSRERVRQLEERATAKLRKYCAG